MEIIIGLLVISGLLTIIIFQQKKQWRWGLNTETIICQNTILEKRVDYLERKLDLFPYEYDMGYKKLEELQVFKDKILPKMDKKNYHLAPSYYFENYLNNKEKFLKEIKNNLAK